MDGSHFDSLTRTLTAPLSRRVTLGGLAAGVLAALGLALDETTVLANKKKKKKKKDCPQAKPNRCGDKCCKPSDRCKKGKCIDHCNDGVENFGETDTDCGGTCRDIRKCRFLQECEEDADCFNNVCVKIPTLGFPVCLDCRETVDCGRLGDPLRFACINNLCDECSRDADCPRPGQRPEQDKCVEPVEGGCPAGKPCVCRQCRINADCPQGKFCDETGTCQARVQGACREGQHFCNGGGEGCNGDIECDCYLTTNQRPFCAFPTGNCFGCAVDSDCTVSTGSGSACVDVSGCGTCGGSNGRMCFPPCATSP